MTFKQRFPNTAVEYIQVYMNKKSRSEIARRIYEEFGYPCTLKGVKGVIRKLNKEGSMQPVLSSDECISG